MRNSRGSRNAAGRVGLQGGGGGDTYFLTVGFTAGVSLGKDNRLEILRDSGGALDLPEVDGDWRPVAVSHEGVVESSEVV